MANDRTAARDLERAKRSLVQARRRLAASSQPGDDDHVPSPEWRWAQDLVKQRSNTISRLGGIAGWGLGRRRRNGVVLDESCLTVFVTRKYSRQTLDKRGITRIPNYVRSGQRRLPVDVVELGQLHRQVSISDSVGPRDKRKKGTLGTFATDLESSQTAGITAMHVTGRLRFPTAGGDPVGIVSPSLLDAPTPPVVGLLARGTRKGIDAAKVNFPGIDDPSMAIPGIGQVMGWRPTSFPGDNDAPVRMFGAVSGLRSGLIVHPSVELPEFNLDFAILADIKSEDGDSGAALLDNNRLVLGFLVGVARASGLRVFTPASLVLNRLRCNIPSKEDPS